MHIKSTVRRLALVLTFSFSSSPVSSWVSAILFATTMRRGTLHNPTSASYASLAKMYGDRVSCPCTSISMNYSSLMQIQLRYHQVCSSDLTSSSWIEYVSSIDTELLLEIDDYRLTAPGHFILLSVLCSNARITADNALQVLLQTQYVAAQMMSEELFASEMATIIENWKLNTIAKYLSTIQLAREMHYGNQLFKSAHVSDIEVGNGRLFKVSIEQHSYENECSCRLSRSCRSQLGIYPALDMPNNSYPILLVPNMFLGCLPIEGLLLSTLECFYNRSCMTQLDQYMYSSLGDAFYFSPLDPDLNRPDETIEQIVERLMIDAWTWNISYDAFFDQCAPIACTYEYTARNNLLIVISTMIGVFGGLSLAIKITVLVILRIVERMIRNFTLHGFRTLVVNIFICPTERHVIRPIAFLSSCHHCSRIDVCLIGRYASNDGTYRIERPSLDDLSRSAPTPCKIHCSVPARR